MTKVIKIPFIDELKQQLIDGNIVMTSRTRRFGNPGDKFVIEYRDKSHEFKILGVIRLDLETVARVFHAEHGFKMPRDYRQVWKKLHPIKGFIGNQLVTTHIFRKL